MKVSNAVDTSMFWIIEPFLDMKNEFPRLLIYCVSINDGSKIYNYITKELPSCAKYIELYHSETVDVKKDYI